MSDKLYEEYKEEISEHNKYIDSVCQLHKEAIEDMYLFLQSKKDSDSYVNIEEKYKWIKNYHNSLMKANSKREFLL